MKIPAKVFSQNAIRTAERDSANKPFSVEVIFRTDEEHFSREY